MAFSRKGFQAKQSRRMSRRMDESLVGSHVQRPSSAGGAPRAGSHARSAARGARLGSPAQLDAVAPSSASRESDAAFHQRTRKRGYVQGMQRRARTRRVLVFVVVVLVIAAIAAGAGFLALRSSVGSQMALRNSDAADALVAVRADEPYFALVSVELGAAAEPLQKAGPDILLLAYVDSSAQRLAFANVPSSLQVSVDNAQRRLGDVAEAGDAALIRAVQNAAKVDISHFVKVGKGGVEGIVDALDGVELAFDREVDDPHAGDVYLPAGTYTVNGAGAVTFLRADNLPLGTQDQLANQADFAALLLSRIFSDEGSFMGRIEAMGSFFQTDLSLADIEAMAGWLSGRGADDYERMVLPGYMTSTAGVVDKGESLYVCTADDMAGAVAMLEGTAGESEAAASAESVSSGSAAPAQEPAASSFTVEVQNGTDIAGAASATAESLTALGFRVEKSGNAEQQVYTETLVVYKTSDGSQASAAAGGDGVSDEGEGGQSAEIAYYDDEGNAYDDQGNPVEEALDAPESSDTGVSAAGGNGNGVGLARAESVIAALGLGRAVEAGSYYTFDTDVLVIIGSDYKPVS